MLLLNCFADKKPRQTTYVITNTKRPSPEQTSSFLNQIFFQWFFKTTWIGYRRPLTEDDIYDINPENTSRELVPPFDKYFAESVEKGRRYGKSNSSSDYCVTIRESYAIFNREIAQY